MKYLCPRDFRRGEMEENMLDYLVVGSGLFGAVFAQQAKENGKSVLVIDKRNHIAGNIYTENVKGINVHKYGAHIFHTNNKKVWEYVNRFTDFNRFTNSPVAYYKGELYSLPFNMYTFNKMWGVISPKDAMNEIEKQKRKEGIKKPSNLEEQAISLVGRDVYEKLVKGYTEKQWGRKCCDLPAFIIKRLPVRFVYDNNYFDALFQGIPTHGYTDLIANMLNGIDVELGVDYLKNKEKYDNMAKRIVYSGPIDAYFDYKYGYLEYRSLRFEEEEYEFNNYQGNAVVNYTDGAIPWTRIIEHKWFQFGKNADGHDISNTIISKEFSKEWHPGEEPYYPVNDKKNQKLYEKYRVLSQKQNDVIFGGRLGEYRYYDMDAVIESALNKSELELQNINQ